MKEDSRVRGLWCATLTPIDRAGGIDSVRFSSHARGLLAAGVDGIAPFGTTGEGPSFSVTERRVGLEALLRAGLEPRRLMAAMGCASAVDALELTRHALYPGMVRALFAPDVSPAAEATLQRFLDILVRFPFLPAFKAIKAAQADDPQWCVLRTPWLPLTGVAHSELIGALRRTGLDVGPGPIDSG